MADPGQLARLKSDVKAWNQWRLDHPGERIDLEGAELSDAYLWEANLSGAALAGANLSESHLVKTDLKGANLRGANLAGAQLLATILEDADLAGVNFTKVAFWRALLFRQNLAGANFTDANMFKTTLAGSNLKGAIFERTDLKEANIIAADLTGARLCGADLREANLAQAVLSQADLTSANLFEANLSEADFSGATLVGANLQAALCVNTIFDDADLSGCRVYGLSAWDLRLKGATQHDLVITPDGMADVAVGNLGVAQFLYLLLSNPSIRDVVDTITSKVVLILGRFTPERKAVLDRLREVLRAKGYSPVLFDFEKPTSRDITETVRILAGLARFVVADITDAKSIPQELMAIVPDLPSVPVSHCC